MAAINHATTTTTEDASTYPQGLRHRFEGHQAEESPATSIPDENSSSSSSSSSEGEWVKIAAESSSEGITSRRAELTQDASPVDKTPHEETPYTPAHQPPIQDPPTEECICRICYGPADADPFISPCKCKGTMKFVHVSCLNEWRNVSRNKKSYVECDHCRYRYHFRRTTWAKLVVNEAVVTGLTLLLFLCFVILAGFMAKLIIYYFFQPSPDDNNDLLPDTDPSDPHPSDDNLFLLPPQSLSTLLKIDLPHLLSGLLVIGILGFFQLFITFLTGPLGNFPRIRTTHRDGTPNLIIILLIAIGVVRTMWALYKGVRRYCRGRLRFVERGILDVAEES